MNKLICCCTILLSMALVFLSSCSKKDNNAVNASQLASLVEDYHLCYGMHWGEQYAKDSLEINMCFYQRDSNVYVALAGHPRTGGPWDLLFYTSDLGYIRSDMLGYCKLGKDGLGIYNSVSGKNRLYVNQYIHGMVFENANEMLKRQTENSDYCEDYFHLFCIYKIDSCCNFCLIDSGYYYQLKYNGFMFNY